MVEVKEIRVERTCCFLPIVSAHRAIFNNRAKAEEALINRGYKKDEKNLNRQDYKNFEDHFIDTKDIFGNNILISKYTRSLLVKDENDADVYIEYVAYIY